MTQSGPLILVQARFPDALQIAFHQLRRLVRDVVKAPTMQHLLGAFLQVRGGADVGGYRPLRETESTRCATGGQAEAEED